MGTKSRHRQDKARRRAAHARQHSSPPIGEAERAERAERADARTLRQAMWIASGLADGDRGWAERMLAGCDLDALAGIAEPEVESLVSRASAHGWQPSELVRHARRDDATLGRLVATAIAVDLTRRERPTLHPAWLAQAEAVAAAVVPAATTPSRHLQLDGMVDPPPAFDASAGWLADAVRDESLPGLGPQVATVHLLTVLGRLGRLPTIVPPPGSDPASWVDPDPARAPGGDDSVLAKVRALLTQAESTTFDAEAETFTAKAQELIARHSIDVAMVWARGGRRDRPSSVRIAIDDPYANEKAVLLATVARNSRCKVVEHSGLGLHSVFGFAADLAAVDLLFTSLLVQAQTAMVAEAAAAPPGSHVRGAAFRRAFLYGYARRIDERLDAVNRLVEEDAGSGSPPPAGSTSPGLLPVLAARTVAIDDEIAAHIGPTTVKHAGSRSYDRFGWDRGGQAADRAELHRQLD